MKSWKKKMVYLFFLVRFVFVRSFARSLFSLHNIFQLCHCLTKSACSRVGQQPRMCVIEESLTLMSAADSSAWLCTGIPAPDCRRTLAMAAYLERYTEKDVITFISLMLSSTVMPRSTSRSTLMLNTYGRFTPCAFVSGSS